MNASEPREDAVAVLRKAAVALGLVVGDVLSTHPRASTYPDGPCLETDSRDELQFALAELDAAIAALAQQGAEAVAAHKEAGLDASWTATLPDGRVVRTTDNINWTEEAAAPQADQQGVDCPRWTRDKPQCAGVYGVRGFNFGADPEDQFEAVVLVREHEGDLICNLHQDTSDAEFDDWSLVSDMSSKFEWCRFDYAALATGAPR